MKKAIVSCVLLLALAWSAAAADGLFETVVRASGYLMNGICFRQ